MRKAPHEGLNISLEVKFDVFEIRPEFLQAKEYRETLEFIGLEFPLLLGECPRRKHYWPALAIKILQQYGGHCYRTGVGLKNKPTREIGHTEDRRIDNGQFQVLKSPLLIWAPNKLDSLLTK
jgi:hypothetical protein